MYRATTIPASQQSVEGINKQKKKVWRKNKEVKSASFTPPVFPSQEEWAGKPLSSTSILQTSFQSRPILPPAKQWHGCTAPYPFPSSDQLWCEYEVVAPHLTGYQMPVLNLMWLKATYPTEPYHLTPLSSFILHTSILFSSLSYSMGIYKNVCNVNTGPQ